MDRKHKHAPSTRNPKSAGPIPSSLPSDDEIETLASLLRILSDPGRLRLLTLLRANEELAVFDLAILAGMNESTASHALRLLRAHQLVAARRQGRLAFYSLKDRSVGRMLDHLLGNR